MPEDLESLFCLIRNVISHNVKLAGSSSFSLQLFFYYLERGSHLGQKRTGGGVNSNRPLPRYKNSHSVHEAKCKTLPVKTFLPLQRWSRNLLRRRHLEAAKNSKESQTNLTFSDMSWYAPFWLLVLSLSRTRSELWAGNPSTCGVQLHVPNEINYQVRSH